MSNTVTSQTASEYYAERLPKQDPAVKAEAEDAKTTPEAADTHEKPKKPIQPRINELVAERNSARDIATSEALRADKLEAELAEIRKQIQVLNTPTPHPDNAKPSRAAFATDDDYQEAVTDWKVDQRLAERSKADAEARQKALQAQMVENWKGRADTFRESVKDFDAIVGKAEVELPQYLYDAVIESDIGPRLAYHFAQNPTEARRLVAMTATAALRELGKLETKLEAMPDAKEEAGSVKGKTVHEKSNAPEPIETLKNASSPVEKDPAKMSYQEFKAWRAKTR